MSSSVVATKLRSGVRHHQAGDAAAAYRDYADVLKLQPTNADALHLSGLLAHASGNHQHAEVLVNRAIQISPEEAKYRVNLAAILVAQHRSVEAETVSRSVLKTDPTNVDALTHLGTSLGQQNRRYEALGVFQSAMGIQKNATTLTNTASVLIDLGRIEEAHQLLLLAKTHSQNLPQIHVNLSVIEHEKGDAAAALKSLLVAEMLAPDLAEIQINRGNILLKGGESDKAIECFHKAISIDSSNPKAVDGLGRALQTTDLWAESLEAQRLAYELDPFNHSQASSYLYSCCLSPLLSAGEVYELHRSWGASVEANTPTLDFVSTPKTQRPLRVGYVSPDFRSHATMKFISPLLRAHDRSTYEFYLYSQTSKPDETTEVIKAFGDSWCETRGLSDDQLAAKIQSDGIDILVDLAGHTADNRLGVFARKPAPIQVSFMGYPYTTGLSRVDYYLTDGVRDPETADSMFVEELIRLPHIACSFQPVDGVPIAALPLLSNGYLTFGSTHRLEKLTSQTLETWSRVLARLPDSQLLVFRDVLKSESLRCQTLERLKTAGIRPEQVKFGWELPSQHLNVYNDMDILLDVFPWGSGTTGFESMWMGVPLPTIVGARSSSRGAASLVHYSGFPELAAANADDYVEVVCNLASDSTRLNSLRHNMRPAMKSTVCNAAQFAKDVEDAYQNMWRRHVKA